MVDNKKGMLLNHYDVLGAFSEDYYQDLITKDHLGEETVIKYKEKQLFIFPVKYKGRVFAIPSEEVIEANKLPIKIQKSEKCAYGRNVFHVVKKFSSARIRDDNAMSFRALVDTLANFEHSHKDTEFLVYKITSLMLYLRKGFARVVSEAAFGKNAVPTILKALMRDIAITNPRTTAAFEHKLINKEIVLDELTNLEKAQRDLMQEALLQVADGSNSYEKGTRGSAKIGTKDEYNISHLSIQILYNIYDYYVEAGQGDKYFDNVFQPAVKDRFLPLYFEGTLNSMQFANVNNPKEVATKYKDDIIKIVRALKHYLKYFEKYDKKHFKLKKEYVLSRTGRQDKTFHMICQGLRTYANTEEEYNKLAEVLHGAHIRYNKMINAQAIEEVSLDSVMKPKEKKENVGQSKLM